MKKKLKLNELKVQSFVTAEAKTIKGGATEISCLAFISCHVLQCVISEYGAVCPAISGSIC